jgi:hypothetical protein
MPSEDALDRDYKILAVGFNHAGKGIRVGPKILVNQDLTGPISDAHVHHSCVKVDSAVEFVLLRIEPHS